MNDGILSQGRMKYGPMRAASDLQLIRRWIRDLSPPEQNHPADDAYPACRGTAFWAVGYTSDPDSTWNLENCNHTNIHF